MAAWTASRRAPAGSGGWCRCRSRQSLNGISPSESFEITDIALAQGTNGIRATLVGEGGESPPSAEVTVVREGQRLEAEHVIATLAPGSTGELALSKVEATGNVRIATPREFVRADRGTYDVEKQFAVLTGGVKVTQDQNQLNGEYAEVDLKAGVSRLLGAPPGGEGKVKGLVLPGAVPEPGG